MYLHSADVDMFWYWVKERHAIYERRQLGLPKPWTKDRILQRYRFTNVFRELDAGTIWMREHLTGPNADRPLEEIILNCTWYRLFNLIATGEFLGWQTSWSVNRISRALQERKDSGVPIFTHAHVVRGENGMPKALSIAMVVQDVVDIMDKLIKVRNEKNTLQSMYEKLHTVYLIGDFMAYEITTDLRHTRVLNQATDIMTWANLGPGAKKGLQRLGRDTRNGARSVRRLLAEAKDYLPENFPPMEPRDIEHSLCEFDKYCREYFHEPARLRPFNGRP